MTITRRIEWNGDMNILVLDNGPHGRIEMTLGEFLQLADDLKASLLLDEHSPTDPRYRPPRRSR